MKKFLQQQINFGYAMIVMLVLVMGVAAASAAAPGQSTNPLIHRGGGDQAVSQLQIGNCSGGNCGTLGSFDTRVESNAVTLFDATTTGSALYVLSNTFLLNNVFIGQYQGQPASENLPIWSGTTAASQLQKVNVAGNVRSSALANSGGNPEVCVNSVGELELCGARGGGGNLPSATNGSCTTYGGSYSSQPATNTSNGCTAGTYANTPADTTGSWRWSCNGTNGGSTATCSANRTSGGGGQLATNGQCGSANGGAYSTPPSSNLCSAGNATSVISGPKGYTWSCNGTGGGSNDSCSAERG